MFSTLTRPSGAPADWPEFPAIPLLRTATPLPAAQWPALALSWQMVTPHAINPDQGNEIDAWLTQPGAPGPVAVAYRHRWNRSHPYGWHCGVHVYRVPLAGAGNTRSRVSYDCRRWGIHRTPEEAQDGALRHVHDEHQDAAVPYPGRDQRAHVFYG
ncbi:hypothetical protein [Streptomyces virginiae]|uniref:hypothetical protein n=1 Tax=Streptomyces virginiae TaxID=1961 RepID=UPI0036504ED1